MGTTRLRRPKGASAFDMAKSVAQGGYSGYSAAKQDPKSAAFSTLVEVGKKAMREKTMSKEMVIKLIKTIPGVGDVIDIT